MKPLYFNTKIILFLILVITALLNNGCSKSHPPSGKQDLQSSESDTEISSFDVRSILQKVRLISRTEGIEQAFLMLEEAIQKYPEQPQFYQTAAELYLQQNDLSSALDICRQGLNAVPNNFRLMEEKAYILLKMGEAEESVKMNLQILKLFEMDTTASPDTATLSREQIARAYKKYSHLKPVEEAYNEVLEMLEAELKEKPEDELLKRELGVFYREGGKYQEAVKIFKRIKETEPENLFIPLEIAKTHYFAGEYSKAEAVFTNTIEKNPDNFRAYRNFGWYWMDRGLNSEGDEAVRFFNLAQENYEKALSFSPLPIDTSFQQFKAAEAAFHRWKITGLDSDKKTALEAFENYFTLAPEWTTTDIADSCLQELKKP